MLSFSMISSNKYKILHLLFTLFLTMAAVPRCNKTESQNHSGGKPPNNSQITDPQHKDSIRVAVASMLSARESYAQYNELLSIVGNHSGLKIKTVYQKKYHDVLLLFKQGEIDVAFICSALYIIGKRQNLFDILAVPIINKKKTYCSYIIVPSSSKARKLEDLARTKFAFTDELSLTGYFFPRFRTKHIPDFWKETLFTGSHDNSILLVNRGLADGASVDGLIYESIRKRTPGNIQNTRILEVSEDFGIPPIVCSKTMTQANRSLFQSALISLDMDSEGQKILNELGIDSFEIAHDSLYVSISKMVPTSVAK